MGPGHLRRCNGRRRYRTPGKPVIPEDCWSRVRTSVRSWCLLRGGVVHVLEPPNPDVHTIGRTSCPRKGGRCGRNGSSSHDKGLHLLPARLVQGLQLALVEAEALHQLGRKLLLHGAAAGDGTDRQCLYPAWRSRTWPWRLRQTWSGITRPATTASPRPQLASITRSSAPLMGWRVNSTPAVSGVSSFCTTTPTLGRENSPTFLR